MNSRRVDVLIVGAGPAGSTLASLLAGYGVEALVVDRASFPRAKPCGECVNPGAVEMMRQLGVLDAVMACEPASIRGWRLTTSTDLFATGRYDGDVVGLGIPRKQLDQVLLSCARRNGGTIYEHTRVIDIKSDARRGYGVVCDSSTRGRFVVYCRFLVGADGLRSVVARRLGMLRRGPRLRKLSITCRIEWCSPYRNMGTLRLAGSHTVGLAPVHAGERAWNATVVIPSAHWPFRSRDLLNVFRKRLEDLVPAGGESVTIVDGPWTSGPFDWSVGCTTMDTALLIGDAAGYYDPLTGQGICQALKSADLAAVAIRDAVHRTSDVRRAFATYRRRLFSQRVPVRLFQQAIERVIQHARTRDFFIRRLHASPRYADRIVRFAGDALPVSGLGRLDLLVKRGQSV